ncbi:MAG: ATP-binding protein [Pseudomonadaceae bacterium]|nr:ATP-binding protein [Pseudomonadaceae bacterium]
MQSKPSTILLFRVLAVILLAAACLLIPEVGDNRFILAACLLLISLPLALWCEARFPPEEAAWGEPLIDLITAISLVHLVPEHWMAALAIGVMVAMAPSVASDRRSSLFYGLNAVLLIGGMSFAGWLHDVPNWPMTMLAVAAVYPSVIFYAYWHSSRAAALREREQVLTSLNRVAGGVAHEFNNLLTVVMGHADLALQTLPKDHPSRPALESVLAGSDEAGQLSQALVTFSGRGMSENQQINLASETSLLTRMLQPSLDGSIEIVEDIADDLPLIAGDRAGLQQVILNLLMNAIADGDAPARVEVALHRVPSIASGGPGLELTVHRKSATGLVPRIKGAFDHMLSRTIELQGLGLVRAEKIVREHGGSLEYASHRRMGSTSTVRLPIGLG